MLQVFGDDAYPGSDPVLFHRLPSGNPHRLRFESATAQFGIRNCKASVLLKLYYNFVVLKGWIFWYLVKSLFFLHKITCCIIDKSIDKYQYR